MLAAIAVCLVVAGCGGDPPSPNRDSGGAATPPTPVVWPAWGSPLQWPRDDFGAALTRAELERDPRASALREALAKANTCEGRCARATWSLARIGGRSAVADLLDRIDTRLGGAAAMLMPMRTAPGEPPQPLGAWQVLEDALWTLYAVSEDAAEAETLLLAIARVGSSRSVARLAVDLGHSQDGRWTRSQMQALGVLCSRGYALDTAALNAVAEGLSAHDTHSRLGAVYALGRCAAPSAELLAGAERKTIVDRLVGLIEAPEGPELARMAWRAFAALGEIPSSIPASILGDPAPAWQVEVQAIRALGTTTKGREIVVQRLSKADPGQFAGARIHALLEALRVLRGSVDATPEMVPSLAGLAQRTQTKLAQAKGRAQHGLRLVSCELHLLEAIRSGDLAKLRGCGGTVLGLREHGRRLAVDALLHMGTARPLEERIASLIELAGAEPTVVATAALSALAEIDAPKVKQVLRAGLDRDDVGVVAAAAGAIASRSADANQRDPEAVPVLVRTVARLDNADAVEARIVAIEALGSLARSEVASGDANKLDKPAPAWLEEAIIPLASDGNVAVRRTAREALHGHPELIERFDASTPDGRGTFGARLAEAIADNRVDPAVALRVRTSAGPIEIDLRGAAAPINQANLVSLAQSGFFNGLTWHRVVPDFVIQGGDPRGDGYGGPGYLVPCEWSNLRYERGTVGIALAGKDTGGSQLFITHSPQPHLDGRYTIVGHVSAGLDVVDQILPYDTIDAVEVVRQTGP